MDSRHRDISRTVVLLASLLAQKKICLLFSLFDLFTGICYIIREKTIVLRERSDRMGKKPLAMEAITALVRPLAKKYHVKEIYLFGSYARGEADAQSDLDFLVFGGDGFHLTEILALGEELREVLQKEVDIFEIREVNPDSDFYHTIMKEKVLVA